MSLENSELCYHGFVNTVIHQCYNCDIHQINHISSVVQDEVHENPGFFPPVTNPLAEDAGMHGCRNTDRPVKPSRFKSTWTDSL